MLWFKVYLNKYLNIVLCLFKGIMVNIVLYGSDVGSIYIYKKKGSDGLVVEVAQSHSIDAQRTNS